MGEDPPFNRPFASLRPLRDRLPDAPAPAAPAPAGPPTSAARTFARAVVRMERTGRGGKEVTVIDHLDLTATEREVWLKALKSALGCGGVVEGTTIVLQGDHRKRLPAILTGRGVRKVTTG